MSNGFHVLPHWIRASESALQSHSQTLAKPHQASEVWSDFPRGHYPKSQLNVTFRLG